MADFAGLDPDSDMPRLRLDQRLPVRVALLSMTLGSNRVVRDGSRRPCGTSPAEPFRVAVRGLVGKPALPPPRYSDGGQSSARTASTNQSYGFPSNGGSLRAHTPNRATLDQSEAEINRIGQRLRAEGRL
jgi:hypothetical protein